MERPSPQALKKLNTHTHTHTHTLFDTVTLWLAQSFCTSFRECHVCTTWVGTGKMDGGKKHNIMMIKKRNISETMIQ